MITILILIITFLIYVIFKLVKLLNNIEIKETSTIEEIESDTTIKKTYYKKTTFKIKESDMNE